MDPKQKARNPHGNPEFGITIKKERTFEDPMTERITIRFTKDQKKQIDKFGGATFVRRTILEALEKMT